MEKKFIMTAFGKDRPGFVADITRLIYKNGCNLEDSNINIANLDSKVDYFPESGTAYYIMEIQIEVSEGASLDNLEQGLAQIADKLNVDITLD